MPLISHHIYRKGHRMMTPSPQGEGRTFRRRRGGATKCVPLSCFSHVWLFATLKTIAHQAPLSMGSNIHQVLSSSFLHNSRLFCLCVSTSTGTNKIQPLSSSWPYYTSLLRSFHPSIPLPNPFFHSFIQQMGVFKSLLSHFSCPLGRVFPIHCSTPLLLSSQPCG